MITGNLEIAERLTTTIDAGHVSQNQRLLPDRKIIGGSQNIDNQY
jgi:hypothetical protein